MARPFPLQTVRALARDRAEGAARELGGHGRRLEAARAKLAQLEEFRRQYETERMADLARGIDAARLRDHTAFIARLGEALGAQVAEVERVQAIFDASRARWLELRRKEQAMDALAERHARAEALRDQRLEQKAMDEFSQRRTVAALKARPG